MIKKRSVKILIRRIQTLKTSMPEIKAKNSGAGKKRSKLQQKRGKTPQKRSFWAICFLIEMHNIYPCIHISKHCSIVE